MILSPDKPIDIRELQTVFYAKEQGRIFVDQGARIGLSGGEQGREIRRRFIGFESWLLRIKVCLY